MGLKPGYKDTELGLVPDDWEVVSTGSVASFTSGDGINIASLREESFETPIPVYGGNGIAGYTADALVRGPTVVIGRVGQKCGEVYLTGGPSWITDNALYPRCFHRQVDVRFLALALKAAGLNRVKNRNDLPLVTQTIVHSVRVAIPPTRAEQEEIAEALRDADALILSLEQLLAKKRQLKQGAMQEFLTGKKRLPGFGGVWEPRKLGEIGCFLKGAGVKKSDAAGGSIPCVRYGEIYTRHRDYIRQFFSWIAREAAETATRIMPGDILFAGSGETKEEIGKCVAFVDDIEAYAGGDIVILRPGNANSLFLGYYLNTEPIRRQKASRGQGDAVVHISTSALAAIDTSMPSTREQAAIAAVLCSMDGDIAALEAKLEKTRVIKHGMAHELLRGAIRLPIDEYSGTKLDLVQST